jgi:hypothetical protein
VTPTGWQESPAGFVVASRNGGLSQPALPTTTV